MSDGAATERGGLAPPLHYRRTHNSQRDESEYSAAQIGDGIAGLRRTRRGRAGRVGRNGRRARDRRCIRRNGRRSRGGGGCFCRNGCRGGRYLGRYSRGIVARQAERRERSRRSGYSRRNLSRLGADILPPRILQSIRVNADHFGQHVVIVGTRLELLQDASKLVFAIVPDDEIDNAPALAIGQVRRRGIGREIAVQRAQRRHRVILYRTFERD